MERVFCFTLGEFLTLDRVSLLFSPVLAVVVGSTDGCFGGCVFEAPTSSDSDSEEALDELDELEELDEELDEDIVTQ